MQFYLRKESYSFIYTIKCVCVGGWVYRSRLLASRSVLVAISLTLWTVTSRCYSTVKTRGYLSPKVSVDLDGMKHAHEYTSSHGEEPYKDVNRFSQARPHHCRGQQKDALHERTVSINYFHHYCNDCRRIVNFFRIGCTQ